MLSLERAWVHQIEVVLRAYVGAFGDRNDALVTPEISLRYGVVLDNDIQDGKQIFHRLGVRDDNVTRRVQGPEPSRLNDTS